MLHEELTNVRKYITALRDPDNNMDLNMCARSADLLEMNLYSIAARVRDLELQMVPGDVATVPSGDNVVSLDAYKANHPQRRNTK